MRVVEALVIVLIRVQFGEGSVGGMVKGGASCVKWMVAPRGKFTIGIYLAFKVRCIRRAKLKIGNGAFCSHHKHEQVAPDSNKSAHSINHSDAAKGTMAFLFHLYLDSIFSECGEL